MAVSGNCSCDDIYRPHISSVSGLGVLDVLTMLHEEGAGGFRPFSEGIGMSCQSISWRHITEWLFVQVIALQKSPLMQTVTNNSLLRSAFRAGENAGALVDDVLMSAMKSARKKMDADDHIE